MMFFSMMCSSVMFFPGAIAGSCVPLAVHGDTDWSAFSGLDWAAVISAALFVMWSIWRAIDLTMHPGEEDPAHIKRAILRDPTSLEVAVSSAGIDPLRLAQQSDGGA